jgi:hypothetical protein
MNWRHRVQEVLTGKKSENVYPFLNDKLEKTINKCRYKYSGFKDFKHRSMNPVNIIKLYKVGNSVYKIETQINRKACGRTQYEKDSIQACKYYHKQHIYNDYDKIPKYLNSGIDWRRSKEDGSRWVVWEFIEGGN